MISKLNHTGISVSDMDAALAFYCGLLGMELVVRKPFDGEQYARLLALPGVAGEVAVIALGAERLELFQFYAPEPRRGDPDRPVCDHGITHVCFEVQDIDSEYVRLHAAGARFHGPPLDFGKSGRAAYGRDPDGNVFELFERPAVQDQGTGEHGLR